MAFISQAFRFNKDAGGYRTGGVYSQKHVDLIHQSIGVSATQDFQVSFLNVFQQYVNPPLTGNIAITNAAYKSWLHTPMKWWQSQVNFAVWCATAGCGVSYKEHLQAQSPLLKSLYNFHVYYQTRRILAELQIPLPTDHAFSQYNNPYDKAAYARLCSEFAVNPGANSEHSLA